MYPWHRLVSSSGSRERDSLIEIHQLTRTTKWHPKPPSLRRVVYPTTHTSIHPNAPNTIHAPPRTHTRTPTLQNSPTTGPLTQPCACQTPSTLHHSLTPTIRTLTPQSYSPNLALDRRPCHRSHGNVGHILDVHVTRHAIPPQTHTCRLESTPPSSASTPAPHPLPSTPSLDSALDTPAPPDPHRSHRQHPPHSPPKPIRFSALWAPTPWLRSRWHALPCESPHLHRSPPPPPCHRTPG